MNVSNLNERQFKIYEKLIKAPIFINTYRCSINVKDHEVFNVLTGPIYDNLNNDALIVYDETTNYYFFVADKNVQCQDIDVAKNLLDIYFYNDFQYKANGSLTDNIFSNFLIDSLFYDSAFNNIVEKFFYDIEERIDEVSDIVSLKKYISLVETAETKWDYILNCRTLFFLCTTKFWKDDGLDYAFNVFSTIWSKHILKDTNYSDQLLSLLFDDITNHTYFRNSDLQINGYIIKFTD